MTNDELHNKRRGQRMLLTKWTKIYNSTDSQEQKEIAARKLADVLAWAKSVGMSPSEITEDRDLPHRALELFEAGEGLSAPTADSELLDAEREIESSIDTTGVIHVGAGAGKVYAYGYECLPDRLKIGRTDRDVVERIVSQINASSPDRPKLYLVLETANPGALERALHGALSLRNRRIGGGGNEWFRTSVDELMTIYHALLGTDQAER